MRYSMMLTSSGVPTTGLSPEITFWRNLDDTDPTAEDPAVAVPTISQLTGGAVYVFDLELAAGHPDIACIIDTDPGAANAVPVSERYLYVTLTPDDASFTEQRILRLLTTAGQVNFRMGNAQFNADGKMTSARFAGYKDAADATAETDPIIVFDITQTYDGDGNLATYKAVEV